MEAYNQIIWTRDRIYPRCENIAAYAISQFTNNRNQQSTHDSNYSMETMTDLYDIDELPEGIFPIAFYHIDWYQKKNY